jgi:SanA protein
MRINRTLFYLLIGVPVVIALIWLTTVAIITGSSQRHLYETTAEAPQAEAALILGAGVLKNGGLSSVLKDRVDQAIELYEAGKVGTIIASGNRSADYNEVDPIASYLLNHNIPRNDILTDYAGFDTYSSIYRARDVYGVRSMLIVTQSFHLPRAVFIARKLGLEASGVSADRGSYKFGNYVREMFADIKAIVNLMFQRKPESAHASQKTNNEDKKIELFPIW